MLFLTGRKLMLWKCSSGRSLRDLEGQTWSTCSFSRGLLVLSAGPSPCWGPCGDRVGNTTYAHTMYSKSEACRACWSFPLLVKSVIRAGTVVYSITKRTWGSVCHCISAMRQAGSECKTSMKALEIGVWSPGQFCYGLGRFSNCMWLPV